MSRGDDFYFDTDDMDFLWYGPIPTSLGGLTVLIVLACICAGLIYSSADQCASACTPDESHVIDHQCQCVDSTGHVYLPHDE